jgi:RNA polymerase II subunit A-like phosphatase
MDLDAEPSPPTAIHLPPSLPYPITLTSLFTPVSAQVTKGTKALSYTYTLKDDLRDGADVNTTDNKKRKGEEKGFATWEVPIDGEVSQWAEGVKVGSVIKNARSAFRPEAGA